MCPELWSMSLHRVTSCHGTASLTETRLPHGGRGKESDSAVDWSKLRNIFFLFLTWLVIDHSHKKTVYSQEWGTNCRNEFCAFERNVVHVMKLVMSTSCPKTACGLLTDGRVSPNIQLLGRDLNSRLEGELLQGNGRDPKRTTTNKVVQRLVQTGYTGGKDSIKCPTDHYMQHQHIF